MSKNDKESSKCHVGISLSLTLQTWDAGLALHLLLVKTARELLCSIHSDDFETHKRKDDINLIIFRRVISSSISMPLFHVIVTLTPTKGPE